MSQHLDFKCLNSKMHAMKANTTEELNTKRVLPLPCPHSPRSLKGIHSVGICALALPLTLPLNFSVHV